MLFAPVEAAASELEAALANAAACDAEATAADEVRAALRRACVLRFVGLALDLVPAVQSLLQHAVVLEKHGLDLADSATESTFAQESKDGVDTEPGCDEPPS